MTHLKMFVAATAISGGLGLATAASAAPLAPIAADAITSAAPVTDVAFGCGPGFVPRRFGPGCRPIGGPRRFYGPRQFYGPRRFRRY